MSWKAVRQRLESLEWRELDVRDAGHWPLGLQGVCCGIIAVVLGSVSYAYLAVPTITALEDARREEHALLEAYRDDAERAAHLPELRETVAALEKRLADMTPLFPESADMTSLIDDIGTMAQERRLDIEAIRLGAAEEAAFVVVHPISIRVTGSYHRLGGFIGDVANLPRLVTLHDVRLAIVDGRPRLSAHARAYSARMPGGGEKSE
ncbi:type 4a pilus biogenesis protein PilO [Halomonas caseinilytica]|uniref:Type IV pilus assembly protein PilO n=1 Tax=Halomonas caseinilytica TaxID=438744 RepID=A0A1M6QZC2_9GAMM|nr:type 4a pilus biogenesis protein PilO [Halomonas caseinilytica]SHK25609.1 type IV pilus assembly protein PilO [Halomonas caseinilytica]